MQQNNTLPEEIRQRIDQEALGVTVHLKDNTDYHAGYNQGMEAGYEKGATVWATRYQEVVEELVEKNKKIIALQIEVIRLTEALAQKGGESNGAN